MNPVSITSPDLLNNFLTTASTIRCGLTLRVVAFAAILFAAIKYLINYLIPEPSTPARPSLPRVVPVPVVPLPERDAPIDQVVRNSPQFYRYMIIPPEDNRNRPMLMTALEKRPNNLAFEAIFRGSGIKTTMPGSGRLFAFINGSHEEIRTFLQGKDRREVFSFSAEPNSILGTGTYQMSYGEVMDCLDSQTIYLSDLMPKRFYIALKRALKEEGIIELPDTALQDVHLQNFKDLIKAVSANPTQYGFRDLNQWIGFSRLTLYELGSMVIKRENYHVFVNERGQILDRAPNSQDGLRLINACGIRNINPGTPNLNLQIMTTTFKAALVAAESGMVIFPAVGMGVWRGPPETYWEAFLNAVLEAPENLTHIFVCPGHQPTSSGKYRLRTGDEFAGFLENFKRRHPNHPNLEKVVNLYEQQKDMVHLARHLKSAHPDTTISIFNASDPDVTLGYHVGEYVNNRPHTPPTTEENLTAIGTNGLCFEGITGIHDRPERIIELRSSRAPS